MVPYTIAETASDAIISTDNRGSIVYWNQSAEAIFGYSADEATGKLVTIIIPEQYRELFDRGLEEVVSTGSTGLVGNSIETAGLRKDGSIFPCELSMTSWEIRHESYFTVIIRDISEHRHSQCRPCPGVVLRTIYTHSYSH